MPISSPWDTLRRAGSGHVEKKPEPTMPDPGALDKIKNWKKIRKVRKHGRFFCGIHMGRW
jgi:hypothetical protein